MLVVLVCRSCHSKITAKSALFRDVWIGGTCLSYHKRDFSSYEYLMTLVVRGCRGFPAPQRAEVKTDSWLFPLWIS